MFSWILALLLAVLSGGLAIVYLWWFKRRRTEMRLGLQALAGMHWREFSSLVRRALHEQRGLHDVEGGPADSREPSSDFLLSDGPHRWLVSCKHGLAYRIGTAAVNELGAAARLTGAKGGILITEGRVERDGLSAALKQGVDMLDGPRLWPLLQPYLPGDIESRVRASARNEAVRRTAIAVLGACTLGLLAGLGYQTTFADLSAPAALPAVAEAPVAAPAPAAEAAATPATAPAAAPPAATKPAPVVAAGNDHSDPNPDAATLERYQRDLSHDLGRQPGVASGVWLTRQTLAINRTGDIDAIWPLICDQVMRYPALRTVRIQLNARPGVEEPVRWRQCATL